MVQPQASPFQQGKSASKLAAQTVQSLENRHPNIAETEHDKSERQTDAGNGIKDHQSSLQRTEKADEVGGQLSKRASLEASVDALVNMQLAELVESSRDLDSPSHAKPSPEATQRRNNAPDKTPNGSESDDMLRSISVPADVPLGQENRPGILASGLDWSGSVEGGPDLIRLANRAEPNGSLAISLSGKPLRHSQVAKSAPALETVSKAPSPTRLAGPPSFSQASPFASHTVADTHCSTLPAIHPAEESSHSLHANSKSEVPDQSNHKTPFGSIQNQMNPIARPNVCPSISVEEKKVITAATSLGSDARLPSTTSPASSHRSSRLDLLDRQTSGSIGIDLSLGLSKQPSLQHVKEGEALESQEPVPTHEELQSRPLTQLSKRQPGMKSMSVLEADGIPVLKDLALLSSSSADSPDWKHRSHLAHGGGFVPPSNVSTASSDMRSKISHRSKTEPSANLLLALEEFRGEAAQHSSLASPGGLSTILSGTAFTSHSPLPSFRDVEEDMSTPDALQSGLGRFQRAEDPSASVPAPNLHSLSSTQMLQNAAEWLIQYEEIELGRRIGSGSYGEVFRAQWRHTDVAVKRITNVDPSNMEDFEKEVGLMAKLKHPNVVQFLGACLDPPNLAIVTQFMPRGSLFNLLHRAKAKLDDRQKMWMALDCAKGLHYLHSCKPPIVHGDISSKNMLVDRDFSIRVADFGMSRQRCKAMLSAKQQAGTAEWTAPEVLRGLPYHEKADVYSFGVVLHELMTQEVPWADLSTIQVVGAVGWGNQQLSIPQSIQPEIRQIISACLDRDPVERPDLEHVIVSLRRIRSNIRPSLATQPAESSEQCGNMQTQKATTFSPQKKGTASPEKISEQASWCKASRSASLESRHTL